jgi:hypothetical protein
MLMEAIEEEKTPKEIIVEMREAMAKYNIPENVRFIHRYLILYLWFYRTSS